MKHNRCFTFQVIIDITGACSTISFFRYAWVTDVLFEQFLIQNAMLNIADNGYFTFQTIIDIAGAHVASSDEVCMDSPV